MLPLRRAVAFAFALTFVVTPVAADISAPEGRRWISDLGTVIENVDQFPEYVLVAYPCSPPVIVSLDGYCIVKQGERLQGVNLYAIPKKNVELAEISEKNGTKLGGSVLVIEKPKLEFEDRFFYVDKRVVRPAFDLRRKLFGSSAESAGARAATYIVRIESIGKEQGVKAKFVRAKFRCRSGEEVEANWGASQDVPPVPRCPVTDDRGELAPVSDGTSRGEGAVVPLRPPPTRARTLWLGAMIACLGLIGVGSLLRKRK